MASSLLAIYFCYVSSFITVTGLLNHGNVSYTPEGTTLAEVWKEFYKMHVQMTELQSQMKTLQTENIELKNNQSVLQHVVQNHTKQLEENKVLVNKQQSLIADLQMQVSKSSSVTSRPFTPTDVKLHVLNASIQALQAVHSATVTEVTSLQKEQSVIRKAFEGLNVSFVNSNANVAMALGALNSSVASLGYRLETIVQSLNARLGSLNNSVGTTISGLRSLELKVNRNEAGIYTIYFK